MDANDDDELIDDAAMGESMGGVLAYRERAAAKLDQIVRDTKEALAKNGLEEVSLFFLIPSNGHSILTFGTITDPPDDQWSRVTNVVGLVVRQAVGLDRVRCREVVCATTDDLKQPPGADGAKQ